MVDQERLESCPYRIQIEHLSRIGVLCEEALHPSKGFVISEFKKLNEWKNRVIGAVAILSGAGVLGLVGGLLVKILGGGP
jgi:hypothetical protein